jgi:ABC-type multidrug transport system fused ATPase/permease subunit
VSHRLSTLQYADRVLYLEGGAVRGAGTHDELMEHAWYRAFIEQHMGAGSTQ